MGASPTTGQTAWVAAGLAGAVGPAVALALQPARDGLVLQQAAPVLAGVSLGVGGAALTLLDPRSVIGRLLCWSAGAHGIAQVASSLVGSLGSPEGRPFLVAAAVGDWTWPLFVVPLLTLLPLWFPDHRLISRRWRLWVWVHMAAIGLLVLGNATAAEFQLGTPLAANPWSVPWLTDAASSAGAALWATASGAGLAALAIRWRRGDASARTRLALVAATLGVLARGPCRGIRRAQRNSGRTADPAEGDPHGERGRRG